MYEAAGVVFDADGGVEGDFAEAGGLHLIAILVIINNNS